MSLQQTITADLKTAMKNREALRLETIRGIKTAITNELVTKGRTPQDQLTDEEVLAVLKRLRKQRLEAAEQYDAGNRPELADKERSEAEIIDTYLPEQLSDEALDDLVKSVLADHPDADKSKMGILIGEVIKRSNGQVDGSRASAAVSKALS